MNFLSSSLFFTLLVASSWSSPAFNVGVGLDMTSAIQMIQNEVNNVKSDTSCSRSLLNKVTHEITRGTGLAAMVYKLSNAYNAKLHGLVDYFDVNCNGQIWGIWIFKCGQFINQGERGFNNWYYSSPCFHGFNGGNGVHFESDDCPHQAWRETNLC